MTRESQQCEQANALPSRAEPERGEGKHWQRMGLSVDGWSVNIPGEGQKELKSAVIYDVVRKARVNPCSGGRLE